MEYAVRRILQAGDQPLSGVDHSEILALAKAELGLSPLPGNLKPVLPIAGNFSGVPVTTAAVKLLSIDDVRDVNIIKSGQTQPFAEYGLTVVYGNNGSGKSGYSRILKLACQARDKEERILPNVFAITSTGKPAATLKIKHEATIKSINWIEGIAPDPLLTNITVFDGRCARVITDDKNEISYLPYGADVFQKTVDVILKIKADLNAEIVPAVQIKDSGIADGTPSAGFVASLTETTTDADIEEATKWTSEDQDTLIEKRELAHAADSTKALQQIARLNKTKGRVIDEIASVSAILDYCFGLKNEALSLLVAELRAAELAHAVAVTEKQTPEPLAGVASTSQWEILYKAAKLYSEEVAYPLDAFPRTADAVCVLCQQELSAEAADRFIRFKNYIENDTRKTLDAKRNEVRSVLDTLNHVQPLNGPALESMCDEVASHSVAAADSLRRFHIANLARKTAIAELFTDCSSGGNVSPLPSWPDSPNTALKKVVEIISQNIVDITNASKPDEHKALMAQITELQGRKALSARKADITAFVLRSQLNAALQNGISALRTQDITRQGTTVIKKNLTPELMAAVKAELQLLGATRVPLSVKPSGAAGEKATHEFQLQGAKAMGSTRVSQILSEGETRVIAIAGFLAELKLAPHANAIVLDDPVSSLDHVFTRRIAERLAQEGLIRQVILFTHNIAFLMELEDACSALAKTGKPVGITVHTLTRSANSSGITTDGAPWHAMKVKQRVQYLDERVHKIKSLYEDNMAEYNEKASHIYGLLREAWEACVEEDLFYSVVCRYRNSIQTLKLEEVDIEDIDIPLIDLHMSKASTWMTGHDKSKALHDDRPAPTEILSDIQELRTFSSGLIGRRGMTKKRRSGKLKAPLLMSQQSI